MKVAMHHLNTKGVGRKVGYIYLSDTPDGLLCEPDLRELPEGYHGFHIHEYPDLMPKNGKPGGMAGQHYDPQRTNTHLGPYRNGHKGDLPRLYADGSRRARTPVVAPRLDLAEVEGLALILHSGGDNYTDNPPNGGGKSRIMGGIITDDCPYCKSASQKRMVALGALALGYFAFRR
jgi:Cu-Zn family superoxide dismutase